MLKGGGGFGEGMRLARMAGEAHFIGLLRLPGGGRPEQRPGRSVDAMAEAALAGLSGAAVASVSQIRAAHEIVVAGQSGGVALVALAADPIALIDQEVAVVCQMRVMAGNADEPAGGGGLGVRQREEPF